MNKYEKNARFEMCVNTAGMKMNWYVWLVHIVIPFNLTLGTVTAFVEIATHVQTYYGDSLSSFLFDPHLFIVNMICGVMPIFNFVMLVIIRDDMKLFDRSLWKMLKIYLLVNVLGSFAQWITLFFFADFNNFVVGITPTLLVYLPYYSANYIYFKKRRHLFLFDSEVRPTARHDYNPNSQEVPYDHVYDNSGGQSPSDENFDPAQPAPYEDTDSISSGGDEKFDLIKCRKCGAMNDSDYKFCKTCGKKYKPAMPPKTCSIAFSNGKTWKLKKSIVVFIVCLIFLIVSCLTFLWIQSNYYCRVNEKSTLAAWSEIETYKEKIKVLESEVLYLSKQKNDVVRAMEFMKTYQGKADFLDKYIAFTIGSERVYHKYGCSQLYGNIIYHYKIDVVLENYHACSICYG